MKRLPAFLLWTATAAMAGPLDLVIGQRNTLDNTTINRVIPTTVTDGLVYYNVSTNLPAYATLGSGLSIVSGVLNVSATGTQVNSDWNAVSGVSSILNKPTIATVGMTGQYLDLIGLPSIFSGAYADLSGKPDLSVYATTAALGSGLAGKANTVHTHVATDITDSTATGRAVLTAPTAASARSTLGVQSTSEAVAAYYPLASNPSAYINQAGARTAISLTTTGSGAATYNSTTGALNVPTASAATPFNFSQPTARTLAVSTSYQALDTSKAAIIVPSYACQNSTTVLAASACTVQVRMGTGTLTCSTGTVYYTQSLTVALGVLITQSSINPVPIFLPANASMIICPTAGTFTISAVEQSAG